jgi:hypothetical protein
LDPVSKFPETTERPGYLVGFANNIEDALTFKILEKDLVTVLHRSVVRSAEDSSHRNRRVSLKSDVLYVERTIAIHNCHLFETFSRIGSCMSKQVCNMISNI